MVLDAAGDDGGGRYTLSYCIKYSKVVQIVGYFIM